MKKLLHIIATPRGEESRTLKISKVFLENFKQKNPACAIDELDLSKERLPDMNVKRVDGKYVLLSGGNLSGELKAAWEDIIRHINRFISADAYLISTPMWNFGIPYTLKHYIDVILQPKYLFRYTDKGPEGLVKGKSMLVITSRGGDYRSSTTRALDHQEPYLRSAFGFVGIKDIEFINAQPMDMGPDLQEKSIREASEMAKSAAGRF